MERNEQKTATTGVVDRGKKVACVATLTAAGLTFGLVAGGVQASDKSKSAAEPVATASTQSLREVRRSG